MNFTTETEFVSCQEITICLFKTFAFASTSPCLKLDIVKELSADEWFMSIIHEWQGGARRIGNTYAPTLGFKKVIGEIGHCKDDKELNEAIEKFIKWKTEYVDSAIT